MLHCHFFFFCSQTLLVNDCVPAEEYVAFFDRLALVRKCEQVAGSQLTTRTNVLLVRQNVLSPGNGIVFTYRSHKNTKKSHHQGESKRFLGRVGKPVRRCMPFAQQNVTQ